MTAFYAALRDGRGKSAALRRAQIRELASPTHSHPDCRAPFERLDDWR
jgi:CHAT domain-containing protein